MRSNWPVDLAIIDQLELHLVGNARRRGALARDLQLLLATR